MAVDDRVLLDRYVAERDAQAFRELASLHQDMVYATCNRILRNTADAEDATQTCLLTLARKPEQVKGALGGWLHRVAVGTSINMVRQQRSRKARETASMAIKPDGDAALWDEISDTVDEAIDQLPEELRLPVVSYYLDGRKQEQIAADLGVTDSAVSKRLQRGVDALRETMRKRGWVGSVVLLSTLLATRTSQAAPATVVSAVGKLALAGPGAPHAAAAGAGKSVFAKWSILKGAGIMRLTGVAVLAAVAITAGVMAVSRASSAPKVPVAELAVVAPVAPVDAGIAAKASTLAADSVPTPDELFALMYQNAQISVDTATGKYLRYYIPQPKTAEEIAAEVDAQMNQIKQPYTARGAKGLDDFARMADGRRADLTKTLTTQASKQVTVEAYYVSGKRHRTERTTLTGRNILPEDATLQQYLEYVQTHSTEPDIVLAWNGTTTSQETMRPPEVLAKGGRWRKDFWSVSQEYYIPKFLTDGRNVPDPSLLTQMRAIHLAISAAKGQSKDGELAFVLKLGEPGTLGLYGELTVLPNKGYVMAESLLEMGGKVTTHEEYNQFVKTAAGFWIPMRVRKEKHMPAMRSHKSSSTTEELLALEPPQVNVPLDAGLFEITPGPDTYSEDLPQ